MNIHPIFNDKIELGKFYSVPTVFGLFGYKWDHWPVLGQMHNDIEIIGFPFVHYHYDFRFFNAAQWVFALQYTMDKPNAMVMSYDPIIPETKLNPVIFRRRKYYREYPEFPSVNGRPVSWLPRLAEKYKDAIMKDLICPHKGASLRGLPIDGAGCITCPLHGLKWNIETGSLVCNSP